MRQDSAEIRKMIEADLPRVNEIDRMLFGKDRVPTWPFSFEAYWSIFHPNLTFVAELGGKVVGFVVGNIVQEEHSRSILSLSHSTGRASGYRQVGWIDMIGIDPSYQHKGIGRGLVEAFYAECKRNDAVVRGIARESDERLKHFLETLGFRKHDLVTFEKD